MMIDPIQTLKEYDRFRYSKDAEGHEHDPANGQFTGSGGKPPKGLTPHVDNILEHISAHGSPFPAGHQPSSKEIAAHQTASKMGWIKSIPHPDKPGVIQGYELTEAGKSVVGKSKQSDMHTGKSTGQRAKSNEAVANKVKKLFG